MNWALPAPLARRLEIQAWPAFTANTLLFLCGFVLVCGLFLGGATRGGFLSDAILQLLAIPLLLVSLWKLLDTSVTKQARWALWFCAAVAALPLIQLIPLPPWLWSLLPNRDISAAAYDLMEQKRPWMPISVSPRETWLSALSLIPPLSVFLATLLLGYRDRRWLSLTILAVGTLSVFIGFLQVAQGPESPLRFFEYTNRAEAVGFFANRNHFAALGYVLVLLAAAWTTHAAVIGHGRNQEQYDTTFIVAAIGCFTLLVILLTGVAVARSRAGLGLTIVALLGAFALGASDRRLSSKFASNKIVLAATAIAVLFTVQYALYRVLDKFEKDPLDDARLSILPTTLAAAKAYLPFGSGLGTFVPVYALFEKPEDTLVNVYANHAHNDAAELWLETGLLGFILVALFLYWFVRRAMEIWRGPPPKGATELDWSLMRAATLIVAFLLVHSFVDYPLRTSALMVILAFSCALLLEPLGAMESEQRQAAIPSSSAFGSEYESEYVPVGSPSRLQTEKFLIPPPAPPEPLPLAPKTPASASPSPSDTPFNRWGTDIEWPEEWRKSDQSTNGLPPPSKPRS